MLAFLPCGSFSRGGSGDPFASYLITGNRREKARPRIISPRCEFLATFSGTDWELRERQRNQRPQGGLLHVNFIEILSILHFIIIFKHMPSTIQSGNGFIQKLRGCKSVRSVMWMQLLLVELYNVTNASRCFRQMFKTWLRNEPFLFRGGGRSASDFFCRVARLTFHGVDGQRTDGDAGIPGG